MLALMQCSRTGSTSSRSSSGTSRSNSNSSCNSSSSSKPYEWHLAVDDGTRISAKTLTRLVLKVVQHLQQVSLLLEEQTVKVLMISKLVPLVLACLHHTITKSSDNTQCTAAVISQSTMLYCSAWTQCTLSMKLAALATLLACALLSAGVHRRTIAKGGSASMMLQAV
jgi:hypothetical protein